MTSLSLNLTLTGQTLWSVKCLFDTLLLSPGALTKDVVKVKSDALFVDQSFDLSLKISRQDSHQGLGGEPVLGSLLVVTLGHVSEHGVGGLVDVVDDFAKVGLEVCGGEGLEVGQGGGGDVSLPLESSLALLHHGPEVLVLLHVLDEGLCDLQLVSGGGGLAAGKGVRGRVLSAGAVLCQSSGLSHVGGEDNQGEVLGNVVHDLGLVP